jgi:hypothetical protein
VDHHREVVVEVMLPCLSSKNRDREKEAFVDGNVGEMTTGYWDRSLFEKLHVPRLDHL